MPYIEKNVRHRFNSQIDGLAMTIWDVSKESDVDYAGLLNYTCTRLAMQVIKLKFGKLRYWVIATTVGVFHNIADEFYRRMAIPYEDRKRKENGDVDLYAEFETKIAQG